MVGLAPTIPSMSNERAGVRSGPFLFQEKPIRLQWGMARNAICELGFVPIRQGHSRRFRSSNAAHTLCGFDQIVRRFFHLHRVLLSSDKRDSRQARSLERDDAEGDIEIEEDRPLLSICALYPRCHFASLMLL